MRLLPHHTKNDLHMWMGVYSREYNLQRGRIGAVLCHSFVRALEDYPGRRHRRLTGGVIIWIYEALIWVWAQHLMPLAGIPRNATGLVLGKEVQESLGLGAYVIGTGIYFVFSIAWGVGFALIWPYFRRRGYEATLAALFYAMVAWIVMHLATMVVSSNHPNYYDPGVIIGGFMSHFFFAIPLALIVKKRLAG